MIRNAKISIPSPCHEDWNKMSFADKGRFCDSCQKHLYDFTKMSDREILERIGSRTNICGRFSALQLNRELSSEKAKSSWWMAAAGVLAFFNPDVDANAQNRPEVIQTEDCNTQIMGKVLPQPKPEKEITGVVSDEHGALPGANVVVKGTDRVTQTDIDGKFSIMAANGEVLVISFVGLKTVETPVVASAPINVVMQSDIGMLVGEIVITKKRTLAGRFFHAIGNLFKKKENRTSNKFK